MTSQTIMLSTAVAGAAVAIVGDMCPDAVSSMGAPDALIRRGYAASVGAVVCLGALAAWLDHSWIPLGIGLLTVGALCGAHDVVQRGV
jgi:hypothetical protein